MFWGVRIILPNTQCDFERSLQSPAPSLSLPCLHAHHLTLLSAGGVVVARSIKLLDKFKNTESPETRDTWWNEVCVCVCVCV